MRTVCLAALCLVSCAARAVPVTNSNGSVSLPNSEVGRYQPVVVDVSALPSASVTNGLASTGYVDSSVDGLRGSTRRLTDLSVYRKAKDCWEWRNWDNPDADAPAPADFLGYMSSPGSDPIRYEPVAGAWYGAVVFWPDGKLKYGPGEIPPGGFPAGQAATNVNFAMYAYARDGVTELYRFGATASRTDPTNETLVCWSTNAVNGYVRVATTDNVSRDIDAAVFSVTNAIRSVDGAARPLPKYLHALDFDDSYPAEAQEYYRSRGNGRTDGGCSAMRSGGFLFRNFDYPFDDRAEFVVKMAAGYGRYASVGVAQVGTNLTEELVTSGKHSRWYKALPGATVDGINENGVVAEINVVDTEVSGWHTTGDLHPLAAVRWVLDNATNAQHGAEYLAANIRFPAGWTQNFHYMVADGRETWIVENGTATSGDEYHEPDEPVTMTNFQLSKFPWDGMGMERFGLLLGGGNITNAWYTNAYRRETNPPWVSDLAEAIAYTNDIFNAWAVHDKEYFRGKTNNGVPWWQSVHTSVYDIMNRTLRIAVQEQDDWYTFALGKVGTDEEEVRRIAGEVVAPVAAELPHKQDALPYPTNAIPAGVIADAPWLAAESDPSVADWAKKPNPAPITDLSPAFAYTTSVSNSLEASKQDVIADLDTIRSGAEAGATAVQPAAISDMETKSHAGATYATQAALSEMSTAIYGSLEEKIDSDNGVATYLTIAGTLRISPEQFDLNGSELNLDTWVNSVISGYTWDWDVIYNTPTTLSGYGITDAKIQNGTITLGSNSIEPITTSGGVITGDLYVTNGMGTVTAYGLTALGGISNRGTTYTAGIEITQDGSPNTYYYHDYISHDGKNYLLPINGESGDYLALVSDITAAIDHNSIRFSNEVLAVGLNIDTNSVAVLNEIASTFGDFPIEGTATSVGGLLLALAAAVAWLKKNALRKGLTGGVPDDENVLALFSTANTLLMNLIRNNSAQLALDDQGEIVVTMHTED